MKDERKTKKQLISEMADLRQQMSELEAAETERKRAEEALRVTDERFQIALKSTGITLFTQDRNLRFTWAYNPFPDFDAAAILGKTDADLIPPEQAAKPMEIKRRVLETGKGAREELSTSIPGKTIHYDLTVEPLYDVSDEIAGIICASIDITERKQAEEELEKHRERLEELVEQRTKELKTMVNAMAGREIRMAELKDAIMQLREQVEKAGMTPVADDALAEDIIRGGEED